MGFGHRVYKHGDPRSTILKRYCIELAKEIGDERWEQIAEPIERVVTTQKHLPPNVDWPSARLYHYMGLDTDLYTPIFAMARVAGWAAHVIEQLDHNRLMRPRALHRPPSPPGETHQVALRGCSTGTVYLSTSVHNNASPLVSGEVPPSERRWGAFAGG